MLSAHGQSGTVEGLPLGLRSAPPRSEVDYREVDWLPLPASAVVFDLGGVLIDWNPRYLFGPMFADEEAMQRFLTEVCTREWNAQMDAGKPWAEAVETLVRQHPEEREYIVAFYERWDEMLGEEMTESVDLLRELRDAGVRLFALTNWSAEKFPSARTRFPFLAWFEAIVVSGEVGMVKPDPAIYRHLLDTYGLEPGAPIFIDDWAPNVDAAARLGMIAVLFETARGARQRLVDLGVLKDTAAVRPDRAS